MTDQRAQIPHGFRGAGTWLLGRAFKPAFLFLITLLPGQTSSGFDAEKSAIPPPAPAAFSNPLTSVTPGVVPTPSPTIVTPALVPLPLPEPAPPLPRDGIESGNDERRGLFGLPPLPRLLNDSVEEDDEDGEESTYFPEARSDPTQPDIRKPGPDIANFPNSPYTLRQGRFFVEVSPVFLSGASAGSPKTYNAEFLLRYGLTDRVELRLFGNGPTEERGIIPSRGMAPLAWDLKVNLWRENRKRYIPAVGLEVFLLTASGSKKLNQGTQPSINLLFDYTLPYGFLLEWNVGIVGDPSPNNHFSAMEPAVAWALQREVVESFDIFFQGYYNGSTLPRFADGVELGFGAVWAVNRRLAVFGSYNEGVSKAAPNMIFQLGGAFAF